jgi:deoxyguanosine kinase
MFVAMGGCIGAGKSTMAKMISETLGWQLLAENLEAYPFLSTIHTRPHHYFQSELCFSLIHTNLIIDANHEHGIVSDFTLGEDAIFAQFKLAHEELELFKQVHALLNRKTPSPQLTIFLDVPEKELVRRIRSRGRQFESTIDLSFIQRLRNTYLANLDLLGDSVELVAVNENESPKSVTSRVISVIKNSGLMR